MIRAAWAFLEKIILVKYLLLMNFQFCCFSEYQTSPDHLEIFECLFALHFSQVLLDFLNRRFGVFDKLQSLTNFFKIATFSYIFVIFTFSSFQWSKSSIQSLDETTEKTFIPNLWTRFKTKLICALSKVLRSVALVILVQKEWLIIWRFRKKNFIFLNISFIHWRDFFIKWVLVFHFKIDTLKTEKDDRNDRIIIIQWSNKNPSTTNLELWVESRILSWDFKLILNFQLYGLPNLNLFVVK